MITQDEAVDYSAEVGRKKKMPAVSKAQQHLMQAAEHGADFPMAKKVQASMSHDQMHDFAVGSEADKPEHVGDAKAKAKSLKQSGMNEHDATKAALKHPHRHKNLGKFLHPKKSK